MHITNNEGMVSLTLNRIKSLIFVVISCCELAGNKIFINLFYFVILIVANNAFYMPFMVRVRRGRDLW